jgi:hypothetical protein
MGIDSDRWPTIEIDDDDDIPFYSPFNPTQVPLSPIQSHHLDDDISGSTPKTFQ